MVPPNGDEATYLGDGGASLSDVAMWEEWQQCQEGWTLFQQLPEEGVYGRRELANAAFLPPSTDAQLSQTMSPTHNQFVGHSSTAPLPGSQLLEAANVPHPELSAGLGGGYGAEIPQIKEEAKPARKGRPLKHTRSSSSSLPSKRKQSPVEERPRLADIPSSASTSSAGTTAPVTSARQAHAKIERRYRQNIKTKLANLHQALLAAQQEGATTTSEKQTPVSDTDSNIGLADSREPALSGTRKADVLSNAIDYINRSEQERRALKEDILFLKSRMAALEKLLKCDDCDLLAKINSLRMQSHRAW